MEVMEVYSTKKMKIEQNQETRDYSELPHDILQSIAESLGFMELLAFRKTCKSWRSASSTSSAVIESNPNRKPWFLLYGSGSQECKLVPESRSKHYTISIPELNGAKCVSSKQGWLLCLREKSMFFFSPFSGAKLPLPDSEFTGNNFLAAGFSSDPISPDCIVCALSTSYEHGKRTIQSWQLCRGDSTWISSGDQENYIWEAVESTVYKDGSFHFSSDNDKLITCDVRNRSLSRCFNVVNVPNSATGGDVLPWWRGKPETDLCLEVLGIEKDLQVPTCGTVVACYDDDMVTVVPSEYFRKNGDECVKGVWIQPRLHWIDEGQRW